MLSKLIEVLRKVASDPAMLQALLTIIGLFSAKPEVAIKVLSRLEGKLECDDDGCELCDESVEAIEVLRTLDGDA